MIKILVNRLKGLLDEAIKYNDYLLDKKDIGSQQDTASEVSAYMLAKSGKEVDKSKLYADAFKNAENQIIFNDFSTLLVHIAALYEAFLIAVSSVVGKDGKSASEVKETIKNKVLTHFSNEQYSLLEELSGRTSRSISIDNKKDVIYLDSEFKDTLYNSVKDTTDRLLDNITKK